MTLLAGWERERRASVTLDDIRRILGVAVARDVARLVAKKTLERVGRGRYLVRPLRTQSRPTAASAAVQAAVLLQGEPLSDPERTLIDVLDFPALAGSGGEAVRLVEQTLARVDRAKLVEYAVKGARRSTCQRLGVLLERAGTAPRRLAELHKRVAKTKSVLSMDPGASRKAPFNRRWSVIENDR